MVVIRGLLIPTGQYLAIRKARRVPGDHIAGASASAAPGNGGRAPISLSEMDALTEQLKAKLEKMRPTVSGGPFVCSGLLGWGVIRKRCRSMRRRCI